MKRSVFPAFWIALLIYIHPSNNIAATGPSPTPIENQNIEPAQTKKVLRGSADQSTNPKTLDIHKPSPPRNWGKLIQYHKSQSFSFTSNDNETLYEFVFQDESGIIRTATYHESPKGEGFWEVWVWDQ